MSDRLAYVNGEILPERLASVSIRDTGIVYADSVFDTARTFGGKLFRLHEHVDRLFESLTYVRIDCGMTKSEIIMATETLVEANLLMLRQGEDYWVTIRVTSGNQNFDGEAPQNTGATVIIDCVPLPLRARALFFKTGIKAVTPARRRVSPDALSPNAKTGNYLNMLLAQREVSAVTTGAWALMCDANGDLAEGPGSNIFVIKDGVVFTPTTEFVLAGVSRAVVIELCQTLGIECREQTVPVQLAAVADEAFFTSTSLCVCPVSQLNGQDFPAGVPGPITNRIMEAFSELAEYDYVAQYLQFLSNEPASAGL